MTTIRTAITTGLAALFLGLLLPLPGSAAGPTAAALVGRPMPDFSLSATGDRLADYERYYYGRHHLVLTFFPAAFTPV